jgi:predicted RNA methylase
VVVPARIHARRRLLCEGRLLYGLGAGLLSWSFTTLAVGAKNVMASVPDYVLLETAFTIVQFAIVGPLIALAYRR